MEIKYLIGKYNSLLPNKKPIFIYQTKNYKQKYLNNFIKPKIYNLSDFIIDETIKKVVNKAKNKYLLKILYNEEGSKNNTFKKIISIGIVSLIFYTLYVQTKYKIMF
jgi:hypothetical protein